MLQEEISTARFWSPVSVVSGEVLAGGLQGLSEEKPGLVPMAPPQGTAELHHHGIDASGKAHF